MKKYWIVNLGNTYKIAINEGFLWSPTLTKAGKRNIGYENMSIIKAGDIVFSCVDQHIKDIGVVIHPSYPRQAPRYKAFNNWAYMDGRTVEIDWYHPKKEVFLKEYIELIKKNNFSPSPLAKSSPDELRLKQQYLIEISNEYAKLFLDIFSIENGIKDIELEIDKSLINKITKDNTLIVPEFTTREASINIRTAQVQFSKNLSKIEKGCRVTNTLYDFNKIRNKYLIASHIKPWSECSNEQRIDGNNGLFLAPHIDYLFDRCLISFEKNGKMLISESIKKDNILEKWHIAQKNVGNFTDEQDFYLKHHRERFFKKQEKN